MIISSLNVPSEISHALITGIPSFLMDDPFRLHNEISTICEYHSELNITKDHISAILAHDRSTWALQLGGNRHGVLIPLPFNITCLNYYYSNYISTDGPRTHRYMLTLLNPKESTIISSGQLHQMSVWRNFGTSHTLLARGKKLIHDLLESLLPNAFVTIPHLIQHNLFKFSSRDEKSKPTKFDELIIIAFTNNNNYCRRGRTLIHPSLCQDTKPQLIEIALWPFEVYSNIDCFINRKYAFPIALNINLKIITLNNNNLLTYDNIISIIETILPIEYILLLIPPIPKDPSAHWSILLPSTFDEDSLNSININQLRNNGTSITFLYNLINNSTNIPLFDTNKQDNTFIGSCFDSWLKPKDINTPTKLLFKKPWSGGLPIAVKKHTPHLTTSSTSQNSSISTNSSNKFKNNPLPSTKPDDNSMMNGLSSQFVALHNILMETKEAIKASSEDRSLLRTAIQDVAHNLRASEELRTREKKASAEIEVRRDEYIARLITDTMTASLAENGLSPRKFQRTDE